MTVYYLKDPHETPRSCEAKKVEPAPEKKEFTSRERQKAHLVINSLSALRYLPQRETFAVAQTVEEVRKAQELLYRMKYSDGTSSPNQFNRHRTFNSYLPSCRVLLLKKSNDIVGTAAVTRDSEFGLEADRLFQTELNYFRTQEINICEVGAFVIDNQVYGKKNGTICMSEASAIASLLSGMMAYIDQKMESTHIVSTVSPSLEKFCRYLGFIRFAEAKQNMIPLILSVKKFYESAKSNSAANFAANNRKIDVGEEYYTPSNEELLLHISGHSEFWETLAPLEKLALAKLYFPQLSEQEQGRRYLLKIPKNILPSDIHKHYYDWNSSHISLPVPTLF